MFRRFYNMSANPFSKELASSGAHATQDLAQVHKRLDHLARTGGIGLLTADPGMGKTFASRAAVPQPPNSASSRPPRAASA